MPSEAAKRASEEGSVKREPINVVDHTQVRVLKVVRPRPLTRRMTSLLDRASCPERNDGFTGINGLG